MTTQQPNHAPPGSVTLQEDAYAVDVSGITTQAGASVFQGTLSGPIVVMEPTYLMRRLQKKDGSVILQQMWWDRYSGKREWREPELVVEADLPPNEQDLP